MKEKLSSKGFSVLEVLCVVAIIMIVAGLLASSITVTRAKARESKCINNQYQLAKAVLLFATDTEKFPTTLGQLDQKYLIPNDPSAGPGTAYADQTLFTSDYYRNVQEIKSCPEVKMLENGTKPNSYGLNLYITNVNFNKVMEPSQTVMTADSNFLYMESSDQGVQRHLGGIVASYADGHVKWIRELKPFDSFMSSDIGASDEDETDGGGSTGGGDTGSGDTGGGSTGGGDTYGGGDTGGGSTGGETGSGDTGGGSTGGGDTGSGDTGGGSTGGDTGSGDTGGGSTGGDTGSGDTGGGSTGGGDTGSGDTGGGSTGGDTGGGSTGGETGSDNGNNGHGNNEDGVDVSNPGNGHGGPNGQPDPSGNVDDEGHGGGASNGHNGGNTTPPPPPVPLPTFNITGGQVVMNYESTAHVQVLTAQYAQDQSNWYELYVDILITLPGGQELIHNLINANEHGITGDMSASQLAGYSWDSPAFEDGSKIDIYGTSKYWTKVAKKVKGKTQYVWEPHTQSNYNTADDLGHQVWVLKDGDAVPTVPGLWNQMSVGASVQQYTETLSNGTKVMKLQENQVIYFFEMGQTSPYLPNGQINPGYDMNDLVVLVDINKTE